MIEKKTLFDKEYFVKFGDIHQGGFKVDDVKEALKEWFDWLTAHAKFDVDYPEEKAKEIFGEKLIE